MAQLTTVMQNSAPARGFACCWDANPLIKGAIQNGSHCSAVDVMSSPSDLLRSQHRTPRGDELVHAKHTEMCSIARTGCLIFSLYILTAR